jgi:hypothetical protein
VSRTSVALGALASLRVAIPLVASGRDLPLIPRYEYDGLTGDATGFYAASREFIAAWGRLDPVLLVVLVVISVGGAAWLVRAWRRRLVGRAVLIVAAAAGLAILASIAITQMEPPGAAVVGWPLLWSVVLAPARVLGVLDPDVAFALGVPLALAANAVTVFAAYFAGLYATGRRSVGYGAAAFYAFWPLLVGLIGGERAWENGTWTVDAGLALYTEPISTALVTTALALLLSPQLTDVRVALAGVALSFATTVRLTNGLVALGALALLAVRLDLRRVHPYLAGALTFAPVVIVYWPKGYEAQGREPFSLSYVDDAWTDSLLFSPRTLLVLVPLAVLGWFALRDWWPRALLGLFVLANAVFYSFYRVTEIHPRFLFASLPALFVLWVAGATWVAEAGRRPSRPPEPGDSRGGEAPARS